MPGGECIDFMNGRCNRGSRCQWFHSTCPHCRRALYNNAENCTELCRPERLPCEQFPNCHRRHILMPLDRLQLFKQDPDDLVEICSPVPVSLHEMTPSNNPIVPVRVQKASGEAAIMWISAWEIDRVHARTNNTRPPKRKRAEDLYKSVPPHMQYRPLPDPGPCHTLPPRAETETSPAALAPDPGAYDPETPQITKEIARPAAPEKDYPDLSASLLTTLEDIFGPPEAPLANAQPATPTPARPDPNYRDLRIRKKTRHKEPQRIPEAAQPRPEKAPEAAQPRLEKAPETAQPRPEKAPETAQPRLEKAPETAQPRPEKAPETAQPRPEKAPEAAQPRPTKTPITSPVKLSSLPSPASPRGKGLLRVFDIQSILDD